MEIDPKLTQNGQKIAILYLNILQLINKKCHIMYLCGFYDFGEKIKNGQ